MRLLTTGDVHRFPGEIGRLSGAKKRAGLGGIFGEADPSERNSSTHLSQIVLDRLSTLSRTIGVLHCTELRRDMVRANPR